MSKLRYDGRVAVVTGAGGGLGKEYALLLGSRGASVVVNDLGGDKKGTGASQRVADEVVDIIRSRGGKAVANYDSVEQGDKIIQTAIDNFGRIDIVINNAGILRDRTFARISDEDWDIIFRVHVKGSFQVTRAAWPHMRKQKYGRVIMTGSTSGLFGNFGQSNYSAAKMALLGLCNTLALEGRKYNIFCNTIIPVAWSRLTAELMPPESEELFKPSYVAPVVSYLCHDTCTDTGGVFESCGGCAFKFQWQKSPGKYMKKEGKLTIEDVRDNWEEVCDMSKPLVHNTGNEDLTTVMSMVQAAEEDETAADHQSNDDGGVLSAIGHEFDPFTYTYSSRDVILYALGVGATLSPDNQAELKFLYEADENFSVIPTFGVIPAQQAISDLFGGVPNLKINPAMLLHGEQYLELIRPIPTSGTLHSKATIVDIMDKGKGANILCDVVTTDENDQVICKNQFSTFVVGMTGFGGKNKSSHVKPLAATPNRPPDSFMRTKTLETQAALYRLSGDLNPLHIDPQFAAIGGFSTPILHGLCSYGIAVRHVMHKYADGIPSRIKCIKARFSKPVLPGQTIQTDMWKEGKRIHFICKVVENGKVVLSGGYVDLTVVSDNSPSQSNTQQAVKNNDGLTSTAIFEGIREQVKSNPEVVKKIKAVFLWKVTQKGKTVTEWTLDLKDVPGEVYQGAPRDGRPDCTLTMSDDDIIKMATGELDAQKAYFKGKLKLSGKVMLAQKLGTILKNLTKPKM